MRLLLRTEALTRPRTLAPRPRSRSTSATARSATATTPPTSCRRSAAARTSTRSRPSRSTRRIPGARSVKVVLDQLDGDKLYFQNSEQVPDPLPVRVGAPVGQRQADRRRRSTSSTDRVLLARPPVRAGRGDLLRRPGRLGARDRAVRQGHARDDRRSCTARSATAAYFGPALVLPSDLRRGRDRRRRSSPISVASSCTTERCTRTSTTSRSTSAPAIGRLRFLNAAELATEYVGFRDIVVLDRVPNDISVVTGHHHRGVPDAALARQRARRRTARHPNMGLRNAIDRTRELRALDGQVGAAHGRRHSTGRDRGGRRARRRSVLGRAQAPTRSAAAAGQQRDRAARHRGQRRPEEDGGRCAMRSRRRSSPSAARPAHYSDPGEDRAGARPGRRSPSPFYYYAQFMEENGLRPSSRRTARGSRSSTTTPRCATRGCAQLRADMMRAPVDPELRRPAAGEAGRRLPAA